MRCRACYCNTDLLQHRCPAGDARHNDAYLCNLAGGTTSNLTAALATPAFASRYRMPLLATRPLSLRAIALRDRRALSPFAIAACYRVPTGVLSCAKGRAIARACYRQLSLCAIAVCYRRKLSAPAIASYRRVLSTCATDAAIDAAIGAFYRRQLSLPTLYRYRRSIAIDALSLSTLLLPTP